MTAPQTPRPTPEEYARWQAWHAAQAQQRGGPPPVAPKPAPPPSPTRLASASGLIGVLGLVLIAASVHGVILFVVGAVAIGLAVAALASSRPGRTAYPITGIALGAIAIVVSIAVSTSPSTPAPVAAQAPVAAPAPLAPAKPITERQWQLIAKDPGAHVGERVVVYGQVTQFDSGTGPDGFRADVDGIPHPAAEAYAFQTNTMLTGDRETLGPLVQGDIFRAEVTVAAPTTYDNTMGGKTTAPVLTVTAVRVLP